MLESQIQMQYQVFPDKEKFTCLTPEVYVYHNFLSKEECDFYIEKVKGETDNSRMYSVKDLSKLTKRVELSLVGTDDEFDSIFDWARRFSVVVDPFLEIKKFTAGDGMLPHNDVYGWKSRLFEGITEDPYLKRNSHLSSANTDDVIYFPHAAWSTLIYFNDDYEGGEIEYLDNNLIYKPVAGDLVVHAVEAIHAVRKVISGTRYSSQSNINQNFCFKKSFIENFRWPEKYLRDEVVKGEVKSYELEKDPDWQYSINSENITNFRLKKYVESNNIDWQIYGQRKPD